VCTGKLLLEALRRLGTNTPGLKWKEIDEQDVDDNDLKEVLSEDLASALQEKQRFAREELESFKVSRLSYNSFIRAGGKCFQPQINKLILASKRLTAAGWKELGCFLATDSTLEDLDVQCGDFDAAGAAALVSGLKSNKGLKVLDCGYNEDAGSEWTVELAHTRVGLERPFACDFVLLIHNSSNAELLSSMQTRAEAPSSSRPVLHARKISICWLWATRFSY
jgi:hypothetical protein